MNKEQRDEAMTKAQSEIILPDQQEISELGKGSGHAKIELGQRAELDKVRDIDYTRDELFPAPDELDGEHSLTVMFRMNCYLAQMSRLRKQRDRLIKNWMLDMERRLTLLERRAKRQPSINPHPHKGEPSCTKQSLPRRQRRAIRKST